MALQGPKPGSVAQEVLNGLKAQAPDAPVFSSQPLGRYYSTLAALGQQARTYLNEQDDEAAYVYMLRFANLYVALSQHNAFNSKTFQKEKLEFRRQVSQMLDEAEKCRQRIIISCNEQQKEDELAGALKASSVSDNTEDTTPSSPPSVAATPAVSSIAASSTSVQHESKETAQPGRAQSWKNLVPDWDVSQPSQATEPLGRKGSYPTLEKSQANSPPAKDTARPKKRHGGILTNRPLKVPSSVLSTFLQIAERNNKADIETCGILTGSLKNDVLTVTHLIIPKQTATANTVLTQDEEKLFATQMKHDLLTLGWIHTHPSQDCFLSSIDLHTQFSYQIMMPEAVAIVLAPTAVPESGIFSLTSKGMQVLGACDRRGFHKHHESDGLYVVAQHCSLDYKSKEKVKVLDLR